MPFLLLGPADLRPLGPDAAPSPLPWARASQLNLLRQSLDPPPAPPPFFVAWSGWLGHGGDPAAGEFPRAFETWSGPGHRALDDALDALRPCLSARGVMLLLRPHARHVLSDPQGCLSFLRRREGQPFGILLDPCAMLTGDMLPRAPDHIQRALDALADHPAVPAIVLSNTRRLDDDWDLGPAPLHDGLLDPRALAALFPRSKPIALLPPDLPRQFALLGSAV